MLSCIGLIHARLLLPLLAIVAVFDHTCHSQGGNQGEPDLGSNHLQLTPAQKHIASEVVMMLSSYIVCVFPTDLCCLAQVDDGV